MQIRLLVACRDTQQALALGDNLSRAAGGRIAVEATDLAGVLPTAAGKRPDVVLLELKADEEEDTWQVLGRLPRVCDRTPVLLFCEGCGDRRIIGCIRRGASGCLLRSSEPWLRAKAVAAVHRGEAWFGRTALLQALRSQIEPKPTGCTAGSNEPEILTARETEILGLIGNALSNKEIARRLRISDHTVKTHLHRIYVKLHQSGRYKALLSTGVRPR